MPSRTKLSPKEIGHIVADYQAVLPGWQKIGGDTLIRIDGPIGQSIWFDRLRTGAYRPTIRVHVFVAPGDGGGTVVLPQFLGIKNKEIMAAAHSRQLPAVVDALKREVVPSITSALDEKIVAGILSNQSAGRPAGSYALACLYAAMGFKQEARQWITEYRRAFNAVGLSPQSVDDARSVFLGEIEGLLDQSSIMSELSATAESEKAKFMKA